MTRSSPALNISRPMAQGGLGNNERLVGCRSGSWFIERPVVGALIGGDPPQSSSASRFTLWDSYKKHYGQNGDPLVLVAQGPSRTFNPSLPQSVVDRALERDRTAAGAEYLAMFRADIETFVPIEVVEACLGDHVELPPQDKCKYYAFVDPSGGSSDSFTLAISHREGDHVSSVLCAKCARHSALKP